MIVTGGAGYIGSHVCKELSLAGFRPIAVDNLSTGHAHAVKWGPLILADVKDERTLRLLFKKIKPCAVIHLAGKSDARGSLDQRAAFYRENWGGTLSVLRAMRFAQISTLLFSSSAGVYQSSPSPLNEGDFLYPLNGYAASKRAAEKLIQQEALKYGIFRFFNVAGADLEGDLGEEHENETHLIPLALFTALGLRPALNLLGNGRHLRDYIHVSDVAKAVVLGLISLLDNEESFILNLGSGMGYSVHQVIRSVESLSGSIPLHCYPAAKEDPLSLVASLKALQNRLGFRPQHSDLFTIIDSAYRWYVK